MQDFFLTFIIHSVAISIFVQGLTRLKLLEVNIVWSAISLALFASYFTALFMGRDVIPLASYFPDLDWNWSGKIAAILVWLIALMALLRLKTGFCARDAGFTFKQNENSITPSLFVILCALAFHVTLISFIGNGPDYDAEELLYQATMPGFDEEPMFRGIILYTLSLAFVSKRYSIFGANINVAGLILVALFGLLHGVMYSDGEFTFSALSLFLTGFYGFIFLWLREKTGSLLLPIVAHNSLNFVGQFF